MVKRSTFTGLTAVYSYGTPAKVDIPDFAMDQLRLANRFWNIWKRRFQLRDGRLLLWTPMR